MSGVVYLARVAIVLELMMLNSNLIELVLLMLAASQTVAHQVLTDLVRWLVCTYRHLSAMFICWMSLKMLSINLHRGNFEGKILFRKTKKLFAIRLFLTPMLLPSFVFFIGSIFFLNVHSRWTSILFISFGYSSIVRKQFCSWLIGFLFT